MRPSDHPASFFNGPLGKRNIVPSKPGAFLIENYGGPGTNWPKIQAKILQREADLGRRFDGIHIQYWGGGTHQGVFGIDAHDIRERREEWIHYRGAHAIVSWSPHYSIAEVVDGKADEVFKLAAEHFRSFGFPIMLRLWWEFDNTAGFPWSVGQTSQIGKPFVTAWRHVVGIFKAQKAANVGFWFCPCEASPDRKGITASWPDDTFVDWAGSDVYNAADAEWHTPLRSGWASFEECALYRGEGAPTNLFDEFGGRKPFVIGEVGCGENPAHASAKGDWFHAIPSILKAKAPALCGLSFFDQNVSSIEPSSPSWLVDTSPTTYAGFKQMAAASWLNTLSSGR